MRNSYRMKENSRDRQEINSWEQLVLNRACKIRKCRCNPMVAAPLALQAVSSMVASAVKILRDLVTIKRTSLMLHMTPTLKLRATQVQLHTSTTTVPNQSLNKKKRKSPRKAKRIRKKRRASLHQTLTQIQVKRVIQMNLKVLKRKRLQKRNQRRRKRRLGQLKLLKQQDKLAAFKLPKALVLCKFRNQHLKQNHRAVISWIFSRQPLQLLSNLKQTNQQVDLLSCNNSRLINSHNHRHNKATCSVSQSTTNSRISVSNLTWLSNKIQAITCLEV